MLFVHITTKLNVYMSFVDLGKEVKKYMDSGSFVPDDTMISLISKEIESVEGPNWLLDGKQSERTSMRQGLKPRIESILPQEISE